MLICNTCPVECPIDEGRGKENDGGVGKDDAPVRENSLAEVAAWESGKAIKVIIVIHILVDVLYNYCRNYLAGHSHFFL